MKRKMGERGSAHIIIIVVLVVALAGTLGYIFWQKMNTSEESSSTSQSNQKIESTTEKTELKTGFTPEGFGSRLSYKYPENWIVKDNTEYSTDDTSGVKLITKTTTTITSPDNAYAVKYEIVSGGIGGMCSEQYVGKVAKFSFTAVPGLSNESYIELVTKDQDGKFDKTVRITSQPVDELDKIKVGDSLCKFDYGTLRLSEVQKNDKNRGPVQATTTSIVIPQYADKQQWKGVDSVKAADDLYRGANFDKAKDILFSTRVE